MEYVNSKKLEAVANFIADYEEFDFLCTQFNTSLKGDRVNIPCDDEGCNAACPFYSKENFLNWIKKPTKKLSIREVKRPKERDFIILKDAKGHPVFNFYNYSKALEKYCTDLENLFANLEYDLDSAECENTALVEKLSKIREVVEDAEE